MTSKTTELERLCRKYQITADSVYGTVEPWPDQWVGQECHPWTVTLSWHGPQGQRSAKQRPRTLTVSFFQGTGHDRKPTAADVLSGLLLDTTVENYSRFEDWCSDTGNNPDSRSGYKTWRRCRRMVLQVREFLDNDQALINELREAEH